MDKQNVIGLIHGLGGDEHAWVDLKEDYYIQGNPHVEAEFLKDVQALANSDTEHTERYVIVGCNEEDGIIGVDPSAFDSSLETRHILSFEEDDLQEKVDGSLQPSPVLSLHTFEHDENEFGVLIVRDVQRVPSVSTSSIRYDDDLLLREGDIWIRKASGKKRAESDDIERMIERRIENEREFILEGIRRVVELDPGTISDIGSLQPSETGEADITFEIAPEGDYKVSGEVIQREFSDLEEELNADIGKHRRSPDYYINLHSLMRYYSEIEPPDDLEAITVLFESSLRNWLPGNYWLLEVDSEQALDLLRNVSDQHAVRHTACKNLVIAGDSATFDRYLTDSESIRYGRFNRQKYRDLLDEPLSTQVSELRSITSIQLEENLDIGELREKAQNLANEWLGTSDNDEKTRLKYALVNVELELAKFTY